MESLTILVFMLMLSLLPSVMAWRDWRDWWLLRREGVETLASITHHWVGPIGLVKHYYVIYEFEAETADGEYFYFTKHTEIDVEAYAVAKSERRLPLRYAASHPHVFRLSSQPTAHIAWTLKGLLAWSVFAFFLYAILG